MQIHIDKRHTYGSGRMTSFLNARRHMFQNPILSDASARIDSTNVPEERRTESREATSTTVDDSSAIQTSSIMSFTIKAGKC